MPTTVRLLLPGNRSLEMPGVTTTKYAAKRIAEYLGHDTGMPWWLVYRGRVCDPDALVADLDGEMVLILPGR